MYRIYKLTSGETEKCYIGITHLSLNKRLNKHKNSYKRYCDKKRLGYVTSFEICKYSDVQINLIEETDDVTRERYHIENNENSVNKTIPTRSQKEYAEDNKEKISKYYKKWVEENKEHIKQYKKDWIKEMICECGSTTSNHHYKRHIKSKKHLDFINNVVPETKEEQTNKYKNARKVRVNCDICGVELSKASMTRHKKKMHA